MSVAPLKRLAILDDYQGVALSLGPWEKLPKGLEITVFRDTITDHAALVERLKPFDAILAMRERTPFPVPLMPRPALSVAWCFAARAHRAIRQRTLPGG